MRSSVGTPLSVVVPGPTSTPTVSVATSPPSPAPRQPLRDRVQPLLQVARTRGSPGTTCTSRAMPRLGVYARAFLEGRLTEDDLDHFRREIGRNGRGLSSYPHPRLMPDFWEFPTVSMGLGPISAIYQARFNRYLQNRRLDDTSQSRVWAFLGDGETDEPETLGALSLASSRAARQPRVRRELQPAAPRRPGARQRQDHPGARGQLPWRRVERHQGHLGLQVGRTAGAGQGRRPAQPDERDGRRRVPALLGRVRQLRP